MGGLNFPPRKDPVPEPVWVSLNLLNLLSLLLLNLLLNSPAPPPELLEGDAPGSY